LLLLFVLSVDFRVSGRYVRGWLSFAMAVVSLLEVEATLGVLEGEIYSEIGELSCSIPCAFPCWPIALTSASFSADSLFSIGYWFSGERTAPPVNN